MATHSFRNAAGESINIDDRTDGGKGWEDFTQIGDGLQRAVIKDATSYGRATFGAYVIEHKDGVNYVIKKK